MAITLPLFCKLGLGSSREGVHGCWLQSVIEGVPVERPGHIAHVAGNGCGPGSASYRLQKTFIKAFLFSMTKDVRSLKIFNPIFRNVI